MQHGSTRVNERSSMARALTEEARALADPLGSRWDPHCGQVWQP